jgi:hypothetical protein
MLVRLQVKTLYNQQSSLIKKQYSSNLDLRNTTLWYSFHIQHKNCRAFPIGSLAHYTGRTSECAEYGYSKGLPIPKVKEDIRRCSSQYSVHLSAHQNDLLVSFIELPDNRRLQRYLPNDLPTRFLVQLLYL